MPFKIIFLDHLLFAAYLILFSWFVTKVRFFQNSGLTSAQLIIIFLVKVIVGIFYGWIGVYYGEMAQMVDTWGFHYESLKAYALLKTDPQAFFPSFFHNNYDGYGNFLSSHNSWWNDLHNNFFNMLLALFHCLSFGNYYTNVVFYSFITFFAPIGLYRVMLDVFPNKKWPVLLTTFFLPSLLYWTSGIHKDGLVFTAFILIIYNLYFALKEKRFSLPKILLIVFGFLLLLAIRNYLILNILPALFAWVLAEKLKLKPVVIFVALYLIFTALFFAAPYIHPALDFPGTVVQKQQDFYTLTGGSFVPTTPLQPTVSSFIKNTPEALALTIIRPYPSDVRHLLSLAASVEVVIFVFFFVVFLFWRSNGKPVSPFLLFCLFFSLSVLLTIGYTVNFLGAIVRYRSIILPFLIIPMMALIDWKKIGAVLTRKTL